MRKRKTKRPFQYPVLTAYSYQGALTYPKELERKPLIVLSLRSRKEGSHILIQYCLPRRAWDTTSKVLFYVYEIISSRDGNPLWSWVYSANGDFLGAGNDKQRPFQGRDPKTLRFHKGDLVQFVTSDSPCGLRLGIVLGVPFPPAKVAKINRDLSACGGCLDETDDTYVVYSCAGEDFEHAHLPECYLFEPTGMIDSGERKRLLGLLATSQQPFSTAP